MASVLIGTCNWADHAPFYPEMLQHGRGQRDKLAYYARYFPTVEIDTTFYGIPKPAVVSGWVDRTPPGFRFTIKAFRSLTGHEREDRRPRAPTQEEERDFLNAVAPLRESGKLAAVHYQFPPWITNLPVNREWVLAARERHPDDTVAVEFRHRSWFDGGAWPQTEEFLRELDAVFVGVDAPQIGSGTAPPQLAITSDRLSIVRFHGRNRRTWYKTGPTSGDRFDYLYRPDELGEWVPTIRAAAGAGVPVHALLNNNRSNYAVVNAFELSALLGQRPARPPEPVLETLLARDGRLPDWVGQSTPPEEEPAERAEPEPVATPQLDLRL